MGQLCQPLAVDFIREMAVNEVHHALHPALVGGFELGLVAGAGEGLQLIGSGQGVENGEQFDDAGKAVAMGEALHVLRDGRARGTADHQAACSTLQQAADGLHLRQREEVASEEAVVKAHDDRLHLTSLRSRVLMPDVGQVGTDQDDVSVHQRADVVADDAVAAALHRERELVLRMKVPARAVVRSAHHLAVEGLPLALGHFFEDRLHLEKVCDCWRWFAMVYGC